MATLSSLHGAIDFKPRRDSTRGLFAGILAGVATCWSALSEGSAAAHEYDRLVRSGTRHDAAVARVFERRFGRR
jgi:hypothetical protein